MKYEPVESFNATRARSRYETVDCLMTKEMLGERGWFRQGGSCRQDHGDSSRQHDRKEVGGGEVWCVGLQSCVLVPLASVGGAEVEESGK